MELLSRIQFAVTVMFHILFPVMTIGLGLYLVVIEALWLRTGTVLYYRMYRFWVKIFAINYAVGVVTGIVLEFEFGTNWSRFGEAVANVFSPFLYFEVLTAFFLEAGFLAIMVFGWQRVRPGIHFLATCLVSGGSILSAFWIMAANSWMQVPRGFYMVGNKFMAASFANIIFNQTSSVRMIHMALSAFETSVFAIAGISAFFLLKGVEIPFYRHSMGLALIMAVVFVPLQIYVGDRNGLAVFHHQPAKLAAMEGHWDTNSRGGAPFSVIGIPNMDQEKTLYEITFPNALSLLVTHSFSGRVQGLKEFPKADRPNSFLVYWSFRIMAAIGFAYVFVMLWAAVLWRKERLFLSRPFLRCLVAIQPLGWIAVEMGWVTTEVGRQPWLVYNILRASDGTSPIPSGSIVWSLSLFILIFVATSASYFYFVFRTLHKGPEAPDPISPEPPGVQMNGIIQSQDDGRNR